MSRLQCALRGQGCVKLGRERMLERSGPRDVPARSGLLGSRTRKECLSPSLRSCPLRPGDRSRSASPKPRSSRVAPSRTEFNAALRSAFAPSFSLRSRGVHGINSLPRGSPGEARPDQNLFGRLVA